jgi:hypothetical protein
MPSWQFTLISHSGKQLTHTQNVDQDTHETIFIDGDTADADTWRFIGYNEETQARRDWISHFSKFTSIDQSHAHYIKHPWSTTLTICSVLEGGAVRFSSDVVDTFVLTPPPVRGLISRIPVPYTADRHQYCILLRHGDTVQFEVTNARVELKFDPEDPQVQVESSGPGGPSRIKHEIKEEADTDDDTDDEAIQMDVHRATSAEESQHLFSTSREHLSPTPRPVTRESQVVKETPNRRRRQITSQHESAVPESLPIDDTHPEQSNSGQSCPADTADLDSGLIVLPDVHTGELPDTSPSEPLHFHVPNQPTPSPLDQSFSAAEVGMLLSNLNEENPPSQVPAIESPKTMPKPVVIPSQLYEDSSTEGPNSPDPQATPSATTVLEDVAVDIINDKITNDRHTTDGSGDDAAAVIQPSPIGSPKAKQTPSVTSAGRKRKTVSDSSSATLSTKRTKIVEADAAAFDVTPVSTASRSSSARGKDLETPSGSAPTRSSRRVSYRHKSIDSESTPSGSPSKNGRQYSGEPPVILYSNTKIIDKVNLMKFLKAQGASKTEDIKSANFLCVGHGELLKTPKLLHSLTLGKTIVTDNWVSQSTTAGFLLDTSEFLPDELKATKHLDRKKVFSGQVFYVTPAQRSAYKKGWDDVMAIIRQAGGTNPLTGPLSKHETGTITLYLGADKDDNVAADLQERGETVYKKDILGASIVHGELLMDASLELPLAEAVSKPAKAEPKPAKKGGRKKKA